MTVSCAIGLSEWRIQLQHFEECSCILGQLQYIVDSNDRSAFRRPLTQSTLHSPNGRQIAPATQIARFMRPVHGAHLGRQDPGGPHVSPTNLAIREIACLPVRLCKETVKEFINIGEDHRLRATTFTRPSAWGFWKRPYVDHNGDRKSINADCFLSKTGKYGIFKFAAGTLCEDALSDF